MSDMIKFVRQKDYILVKEIGQGGLGRTVLLRDPTIDETFVCKKYSPVSEEFRKPFYENFKTEIKIMHRISHPNIVRVFNYYLYPENLTGYILMEVIDGKDIAQHLASSPEDVNRIFPQLIEAFYYLETSNILHRDIRPQNILITPQCVVKVIDFGFGKTIQNSADHAKSISINWYFEPPNEFSESVYNFRTEIYFVGKLVEQLIKDSSIESFEYASILKKMIIKAPEGRYPNFAEIKKDMLEKRTSFDDLFNEIEKNVYREFVGALVGHLSEVAADVEFVASPDLIISGLEEVYKMNLLEEFIGYMPDLLRVFVRGEYTYYSNRRMETTAMRSFIQLLKNAGPEKQNIIMLNIGSRLKTVKKSSEPANSEPYPDDDIPF